MLNLRNDVDGTVELGHQVVTVLVVVDGVCQLLFAPLLNVDNLHLLGIAMVRALGIDLLAGCAGQLSKGHAAFLAIGAYIYGLLTQNLQVGLLPALVLSGSITALVGLIFGIPSLRLKGLYFALATMGFVFISMG